MTAPTQQYANDAQTTLAAGITSASLALSVAAGTGALFPNPTVGSQFFLVTLIDEATGGIKEIVRCTQRVGDILTIVRGQEGTDPVAWSAGDLVKMLLTAGTMDNMIQIPQAQAQTFKFAQDTGGVNGVVVALSPAVTTRIPGLEINVKIANSNTGNTTLNLGAGSIQVVNPDGSPLGTGALVAGGVATFIDTGSGPYQLTSYSQQAQAAAGAATTGDFSWRPTNEAKTGWIWANATTVGNALSGATQRANADCSNIFQWHWNNFSNTQCPVQDSAGNPVARGANAAADFAANRRIGVYPMQGRGQVGVDTMGGAATTFLNGVPFTSGNATTPGSVLGENLHVLTVAELASHFHSAGISDPTHSHVSQFGVRGYSTSGVAAAFAQAPGIDGTVNWSSLNAGTGVRVNSPNGLDTTYSAGSSTAHNTVHLNASGYFYIKL
jgi:hypothetical protein